MCRQFTLTINFGRNLQNVSWNLYTYVPCNKFVIKNYLLVMYVSWLHTDLIQLFSMITQSIDDIPVIKVISLLSLACFYMQELCKFISWLLFYLTLSTNIWLGNAFPHCQHYIQYLSLYKNLLLTDFV